VLAKVSGLLDERLDAVAATARQIFAVRMAVAGVAAALTGYLFGPLPALAWLGAFLALEVWSRRSTRPLNGGRALSQRQRLGYLGAMLGGSLCWCSVSILFWSSGDEAIRLAGMAVLAGLMVHAQGFSFRSPVALAALGTAPAILWFVLPVGFGGYSGASLVALSVGLAALLGYVVASARANIQTASALASAERDAVAANMAKSAFLAMMSHELRTPMNGVLGMARALQRTTLDPRQQGYVETILRSGDGLMAILNDVLDISKIEAGRMDLEVAAFDLRDLADQVIELWAEGAAAKRLGLTCVADPHLPPAVLGDETRVRQIVMNLVSNALKFTETGSITLELRAAPSADGDLQRHDAGAGAGAAPRHPARRGGRSRAGRAAGR
jgi:signal transduction histidine kinase